MAKRGEYFYKVRHKYFETEWWMSKEDIVDLFPETHTYSKVLEVKKFPNTVTKKQIEKFNNIFHKLQEFIYEIRERVPQGSIYLNGEAGLTTVYLMKGPTHTKGFGLGHPINENILVDTDEGLEFVDAGGW